MVALLAVAAMAGGNRPVAADTASVSINSFAFMPASLNVAAGSSVTWTNNQGSVPHTVTADDGSFDSGRLAGGQTFSMTFNTAGTIAYHCNIHPNMHGTIVVTAASAPAAGSAVPAATTTGSSSAGSGGSAAPGSGRTLSLGAGYNLVGPPAGTSFGDNSAFAFDPAANTYRALDTGAQTQAGQGYWVLSDNGGNLTLAAGSNTPVTVTAGAGMWQLIGDPSGTQAALVTGADAVWTYDAGSGQYQRATMLQPGQGAWAMSLAGGTITIAPGGQAPTPTPSPTPRPQPTPQPQTQPVQPVQPVQPMQPTPYTPPQPYYGPVVVRPMMPMPMPY
jgi:plastocyanin